MKTVTWKYPKTKRESEFEDKYGLSDPYRWLEDPDSPETVSWAQEQNKITESYLDTCPHRKQIKERLTDVLNYPKYGIPFKRGNSYYYYKNNGLQNQSVLYSLGGLENGLNNDAEVFMDPNKLSEDGTVAIGTSSFSESGKYWAYSLKKSGSDWATVYVRDVQTKTDLPDVLEWVKFSSFSWMHDDSGFFYNRYPKSNTVESTEGKTAGTEVDSNKNQKVYYHRLNTGQEDDVLIWENPGDPGLLSNVQVSDCGKYLLLYINQGCKAESKVYWTDLTGFCQDSEEKLHFHRLVDDYESKYDYITNEGSLFYFVNNLNAPRNQIIAIDFYIP